MAKKKRRDAHVVMGNGDLWCLHCGASQELPATFTVRVLEAYGRDFTDTHVHCKPSEAGKARLKFSTSEEWLASWDTGISSKVIHSVMTGSFIREVGVPHDADDFGRCYRLLAVFPKWRARIGEVGIKHLEWLPLCARWDDLERLFVEEKFSELFDLLQKLNANAVSDQGGSGKG